MRNDESVQRTPFIPRSSFIIHHFFTSGNVLILVVVGLGIGLGGLSIWYRHNTARRSLAHWGPEVARLVIRAPRVQALRLSEQGSGPQIIIAGRPLVIVGRVDVSQTGGFSLVRRALVEDASYDWSAEIADCDPSWRDALAFINAEGQATIAFDFQCNRAVLSGRVVSVSIDPFAEGLQVFFEDARRKAKAVEAE